MKNFQAKNGALGIDLDENKQTRHDEIRASRNKSLAKQEYGDSFYQILMAEQKKPEEYVEDFWETITDKMRRGIIKHEHI